MNKPKENGRKIARIALYVAIALATFGYIIGRDAAKNDNSAPTATQP